VPLAVTRDSDIITFNFRLVSPHFLVGITLAQGSRMTESTVRCLVHEPFVSSKFEIGVEMGPWSFLWFLCSRVTGAVYLI